MTPLLERPLDVRDCPERVHPNLSVIRSNSCHAESCKLKWKSLCHWKLRLSCTDTMNTRKRLLSAARLLLPSIGLSFICAGAYINSNQSEQLQILKNISIYLFIILGFILVIVGVLWSLSHGMRSVLLKRSVRRSRETDIQDFTVDRCIFYPPSYEESQVSNDAIEVVPTVISINTGVQWAGPAPPVYIQNCYETSFEDFSHEEPPTYQQAILQSQADSQAAHLPVNSSVEPL